MYEWFQKIWNVWPTFFVNGAVGYVNDTILAPMMGRTFGMIGAYTANGISFAAQSASIQTSYFQGKNFAMGWAGGNTP
jgi:hypothetical protein